MASSTLLKDLEENFFLCSVCLDQFNEPKLLPCLHRYCSDCLKTIILASKECKVNCPMCKQQCAVPENGVDGFKTDFHMKNIIEFLQLQKQLENKDVKECVGCLETSVSAYCFKCRDFLCDQCYNIHSTSKMFIDHRKRTLKLDNSERGTITLEKLATLSENPRCRSHEEEFARLCCTTCGNEPVCIICTYSDKHKGHALRDVSDIAKTERDLLKRNLNELIKHKSQVYQLQKETEASKQQLDENVSLRTDGLIEQHRQQSHKIKRKLDDQKLARERGLTDIESRRNVENAEINTRFEDEMKILTQNYDIIRKESQTQFDNECQLFNKNCDKIEEKLSSMQEKLDNNLRSLTTATDLVTRQNKQKLSEISDYCDQIIKRYENFTSTVSSILASEVDWTDVRCIPDLNSAWEVLIEEIKKGFPDLEPLRVVDISDITEVTFDYITISAHEENIFEEILDGNLKIHAITSNGYDNTIISGGASDRHSHITVISKKGIIKRQDRIKCEKMDDLPDGIVPNRYCSNLRGSKIATVSTPDEIGIYDVSDGSYRKKFIRDIISDWPKDRWVWCVTTDLVNDRILVGTESRYVYVFDDQLNYSHTVILPDVITKPHEIAVHEGNLLVCDGNGGKAYAVNMKESECEVLYGFPSLEEAEDRCRSSSVCTDLHGFIYIVSSFTFRRYRTVLLQYSQDGRHLLAMKEVDADAELVTSVGGTYLLLATLKNIYIYGLTVM